MCSLSTYLLYDRSSEVAERKKYVSLVEAVQSKGGEVLIFSSMHESGQRKVHIRAVEHSITRFTELNQLTGIAAILTFPLDIEVVEAEEREEAEAAKAVAEDAEVE